MHWLRAATSVTSTVTLLLLTATVARADHPASPARPTNTESAFPLTEGSVQVELGYRLVDEADDRLTHSVPLAFRMGVNTWLEARIGFTAFQHLQGSSGVGDLSFAGRATINAEGEILPAFGFLLTVTAPTASGPFADEHVGIDARWLASKTFFDIVQLDLMAAFAADTGGVRGDRLSIPAAFGVHIDAFGIIDLFGELNTTSNLKNGPETFTASGVVGAGWRIVPELVFDIAAEIGVTSFAPDVMYTAGFTWNIADLY